jgi:hypothetical protein
MRPYLEKKPNTKKVWWSGSRCRPLGQVPIKKKKKKEKHIHTQTQRKNINLVSVLLEACEMLTLRMITSDYKVVEYFTRRYRDKRCLETILFLELFCNSKISSK